MRTRHTVTLVGSGSESGTAKVIQAILGISTPEGHVIRTRGCHDFPWGTLMSSYSGYVNSKHLLLYDIKSRYFQALTFKSNLQTAMLQPKSTSPIALPRPRFHQRVGLPSGQMRVINMVYPRNIFVQHMYIVARPQHIFSGFRSISNKRCREASRAPERSRCPRLLCRPR